ncbi:MAG: hypothetical protein DRK00_07390 [Thermoprotei archaeon]|nr:MAG: hypothetical protein DRK00_07390 [Thermoprotei archaeon]
MRVTVSENWIRVLAEHSTKEINRFLKSTRILERAYEGFTCRIELPGSVKPKLSHAKLRDDRLEVHLPKSKSVT